MLAHVPPGPPGPGYDRRFYDWQQHGAGASAQRVVPLIIDLLAPASVVDVGCGVGAWLAEFRRCGVADILGLDGQWVEPDMLLIPSDRYRVLDLAGDIELERTFDLVVCLEVAEHLPGASADRLVGSLTSLGPVILFSAAIPHQGGVNHVNEQWPEFWLERFARHRYRVFDCVRPQLWDDPEVEFWYAQNSFLLVAEGHLAAHPELGARLSAEGRPVRLVHPRMHEMMEERIVLVREETSRVAAGRQELEARLEEQSRLLAASSARLSELELELEAALQAARDRTDVIRRVRRVAARLPGARPTARAILPRLRRLRRRLQRGDPDAQTP